MFVLNSRKLWDFFLAFLEYSKYYAYLCATFDILIVLLELNGIWLNPLEALVKPPLIEAPGKFLFKPRNEAPQGVRDVDRSVPPLVFKVFSVNIYIYEVE